MSSKQKTSPSRIARLARQRPAFAILALAIAAPLWPGWASAAGDFLGGDDIIPINADFQTDFSLIVDLSELPPVVQNLLIDSFKTPIKGGLNNPPNPDIQLQLGAALSQSISASNRPSVLTPYGSVLGYDEAGAPITDAFGSLITNKASTIGKGNLGIGLSYQHSRFDSFDGESIGSAVSSNETQVDHLLLRVEDNPFLGSFDISDVTAVKSDLKVSDVRFTADVITLSLTYGVIDRLDVGALVPYIFLRSEGKAKLNVRASRTITYDNFVDPAISVSTHDRFRVKDSWDKDYDGFGDIILYSKFQILSQAGVLGEMHVPAPIDLALQAEVKLPTGDEDDFLGTGETDFALRVLAQREIIKDALRVRGEIGYNFSGLDSDFSSLDYKLGAEWIPIPSKFPFFSVSGEVIGSYSDAFNNILDGVVGAKYTNTSYNFSVFGGVRFPLNDNGLRYRWSPIVGIDKTFQLARAATDEVPPTEELNKPAEAAPADATAPAEAAPAAAPAEAAPPVKPAEPAPPAAPVPAPAAAAPAPASAPAAAPTTSPLNELPPPVPAKK